MNVGGEEDGGVENRMRCGRGGRTTVAVGKRTWNTGCDVDEGVGNPDGMCVGGFELRMQCVRGRLNTGCDVYKDL